MRKGLLPEACLILMILWPSIDPAVAQKHYKDLSYPKLKALEIPGIEQVVLKNGMKLFLLEDHELPIINLSSLIRVGSVYEPADKIDLASITGTVMRSGGTSTRTGDEIDEQLESIAASVETGIGQSSGSASMSVLKKDLEAGLSILADILMNPAFPEDKIELAKIQSRSSISRRNDDVRSIVSREFRKLIYGPGSVYARHPEYAAIDRITRDDLVAFHKKFFHPNSVRLAVWGDFSTPQMISKIEEVFRDWEPQEIDFPEVPDVNYEFRQTVNLIQKDDVNQTSIYLGHIGGLMNDPDYFPLILMNRVLGIGFTSRLFREVRSRQGLAYSVFGTFSARFDHPGLFYVGCQTKSETTVRAIRAMIDEVKKITEAEITEVVNRLMTYDYYGYPLEFLQKTKENIGKVTKFDILRVAQKHLRPQSVQVLAVGRAQDFDEPLSVLGPVKKIDVTIPEAVEEITAAAAETRAKGTDFQTQTPH
jgi:zinc protease